MSKEEKVKFNITGTVEIPKERVKGFLMSLSNASFNFFRYLAEYEATILVHKEQEITPEEEYISVHIPYLYDKHSIIRD